MKTIPITTVAKGQAIANWVVMNGVRGVPPLGDAHDLAREYALNRGYMDLEARAEALVRWETCLHFTRGFLTGFGETLSPPCSASCALAGGWVVRARVAAAIAALFGHSLEDQHVLTLVGLAVTGDVGGAQTGNLDGIQHQIGERLLAEALEADTAVFADAGHCDRLRGTHDATPCCLTGRAAIEVFRSVPVPAGIGGEAPPFFEPPS